MKLVVLGINHKTAPVEIREKLSFGRHEVVEANRRLKERAGLEEGLILSTCNRMEVYGVVNSHRKDHIDQIKGFLSEFHNIESVDFEDRYYTYEDNETVEHLFRVASGLDSMVVGEMEILGQVKKAYEDARTSESAGKVLNRLFQKTFKTAKKVRTDTAITRGSVSTSSVAIKLARKILGNLEDKNALIVGAGKIGKQLIMYLKKNSINSVLVANRTFEKARELADNFGARAIKFDDFRENMRTADIVIASTGAPHCIIRRQDIVDLMPRRQQKPLFIIDLAVPRDVEEDVNKVDNVYLYDIDDLQKTVDRNIALRKSELENCTRIITDSCRNFSNWMAFERVRSVGRTSKLAV